MTDGQRAMVDAWLAMCADELELEVPCDVLGLGFVRALDMHRTAAA